MKRTLDRHIFRPIELVGYEVYVAIAGAAMERHDLARRSGVRNLNVGTHAFLPENGGEI
jgi:hypothetical protein